MSDNGDRKFSPVSFPASWVVVAHTTLASLAFLTALAVGTGLHFEEIVKNGIAGYPQEWFPSVSATYVPFVSPFFLFLTVIDPYQHWRLVSREKFLPDLHCLDFWASFYPRVSPVLSAMSNQQIPMAPRHPHSRYHQVIVLRRLGLYHLDRPPRGT